MRASVIERPAKASGNSAHLYSRFYGRSRRWAPLSFLAALAATATIFVSGTASAQVNSSPRLPQEITVFPERDFTSIVGFAPNADLLVQLRRNGVVVSEARGKTDATGFLEVNHPGGVCWSGQTPNIVAGDMVDVFQVVNMGFSAGQIQRVIDTKITRPAFDTNTGQVRVNRTAVDASGAPLLLELMEQRIIQPDLKNTRIGRRDIRADTNGGRVENIPGATGRLLRTGDVTTSNAWRAVYSSLNATELQIAVAGQSRAMAWLSTNGNGDRFGITIFEAGEGGGPGMSGCPATGNASIAIAP